jgi:hypothetical protein
MPDYHPLTKDIKVTTDDFVLQIGDGQDLLAGVNRLPADTRSVAVKSLAPDTFQADSRLIILAEREKKGATKFPLSLHFLKGTYDVGTGRLTVTHVIPGNIPESDLKNTATWTTKTWSKLPREFSIEFDKNAHIIQPRQIQSLYNELKGTIRQSLNGHLSTFQQGVHFDESLPPSAIPSGAPVTPLHPRPATPHNSR